MFQQTQLGTFQMITDDLIDHECPSIFRFIQVVQSRSFPGRRGRDLLLWPLSLKLLLATLASGTYE